MADGDVSLRYRLLGSDEGASRAMDKVGRSAQGLHTRMTAVGVAIGGLAAGGIAALGALGVGAVKTGLETASGLQQAEIGFTTMTGSAVKAKAFVGQLATFAAATPFEMPGLVDAARTLMGVGVSAKQVIPTLTAYGDAAGALGIQQDAFQRIMIAVSQSISAGKIKLGDMNQLANNGLPVWKLLSEAMHKPVPEIQAMISHGQLLSADVLPKLQAQMTKDYGGSMAKQSQTLGGLWSTMTDTFRLGMANVLMPLVPLLQAVLPGAMTALGNAFKGLADGVKSGIGFFQRIGPSLHQAFGDPKTTSDVNALHATVSKAFSQIWAAVGPVLRQIWQTIQTQVVPAWVAFEKSMIPVVNFLVKTLTPTVKVTMAAVLSVINGALRIIAGLFNILAGLLSGDWSRMWAGIKQVASGAWQVIGGIFRAGVATVTGIFNVLVGALGKLGSNIMQGLLHGIEAGASAIYDKIAGIANGIKDKFASVLHIFSPSRVMMKLGQSVIDGVEVGLRQRAPSVYNFLESFAQRIGNMKVTARVKDHLAKLATDIAADMRAATAKFDKIKDAIKAQQAKVADLIKARNDYANTLAAAASGGGITNIGLLKLDDQGRNADAQQKVADASAAATKATDALTEAQGRLADLQEQAAARTASSVAQLQALRDAQQAVTDAQKAAADTQKKLGDAQDAAKTATTNQATDFLNQLKSRAGAVHDFSNNMNRLKAEGLSQDVLQQIASAGLETGGALAKALAEQGTPETIKGINAMSKEINDSSQRFGKTWAGDMYDTGIKAAEGILKGLQSKESAILAMIRSLANKIVTEIKGTLHLHGGGTLGLGGGAGNLPDLTASTIGGNAPNWNTITGSRTAIPLSTQAQGVGRPEPTVINVHLHNGIVGDAQQVATHIGDVIRRVNARGTVVKLA